MSNLSVLDHGYVGHIEAWGSDESIIEAARMSTGKGFLGWGPKHTPSCASNYIHAAMRPSCDCPHDVVGDEKLLAFLYDNRHMTPFEMGGMTIEVQAPIFVFREWHRHRTQSYNEMSARYTPLPDVNYIPSIERLMMNANGANKQAGTVGGAAALTRDNAELFRQSLEQSYANAENLYQWALRSGVPKELARVHLPVGRYSRMRASTNLRNWLQFVTLRSPPNAQWEIRQFSLAVEHLLTDSFPRTMELFNRGRA